MGLFPWVSKQSLEVHFLLAVRACLLLPYHAPPSDAELVKSKVGVKVKSSQSSSSHLGLRLGFVIPIHSGTFKRTGHFFFPPFVERLLKHYSYGKVFLYVPLAHLGYPVYVTRIGNTQFFFAINSEMHKFSKKWLNVEWSGVHFALFALVWKRPCSQWGSQLLVVPLTSLSMGSCWAAGRLFPQKWCTSGIGTAIQASSSTCCEPIHFK